MASEDEMLVMNDKELIDLAAKAAGIEWRKDWLAYLNQEGLKWNPLNDDGDAFRLAVKLKIDIEFWLCFEEVKATPQNVPVDPEEQPFGDDPYAATRRAIVRAAAEIGRTME